MYRSQITGRQTGKKLTPNSQPPASLLVPKNRGFDQNTTTGNDMEPSLFAAELIHDFFSPCLWGWHWQLRPQQQKTCLSPTTTLLLVFEVSLIDRLAQGLGPASSWAPIGSKNYHSLSVHICCEVNKLEFLLFGEHWPRRNVVKKPFMCWSSNHPTSCCYIMFHMLNWEWGAPFSGQSTEN